MGTSSLPLAIIIPARNEAAILASTLECLRLLVQNTDLIVVVDDGSDDGTGDIARSYCAQVYRRPQVDDLHSSKGAVLKWWAGVAEFELDRYAGIVILDADSRIDVGFLNAFRTRLNDGAKVVQGFIMPVEKERSTFGALATYSALSEQNVDDRLRAALGWSVRLRGTGMAFRPEVLRQIAPRLKTQIEDVEMSILLAARGIGVVFAPEAIVFDPQPDSAILATNQRARWVRGQWDILRLYHREIARLLLSGPYAWSLIGSLLIKPRSLIVALKALLLSVATGLAMIWPPIRIVVGLFAFSLCADVAYFFIGLAFVEKPGRYLKHLLLSPAFVFLWLRSFLLAMNSRQNWLRARQP